MIGRLIARERVDAGDDDDDADSTPHRASILTVEESVTLLDQRSEMTW